MIPVVQVAAAAYCRAAGAGDEIAARTELVIEEILTNIIQYEYISGQREMIAKILQNTSTTVSLIDAPAEALLPDQGKMDSRTDTQLCGHMVIRCWGSDKALKAATSFGKSLIDYVSGCDPG